MNAVFLLGTIQKQELPDSVRRYNEIDIAKGIGILCIVAGHVFPTTIFNQFLFSFHVPIFFLISGFTYRYYDNKKTFYSYKFRRLIVPYLFFSLMSILLMWGMDKLISLDADTRILPNIAGMLFANSNTGYMTWNSPMWFLPCLFVSLALMDFLESILKCAKWCNRVAIRFLIVIGLWIVGILVNTRFNIYLPFHIESALFLTGFSELGYALASYGLLNQVKHAARKVNCCKLFAVGCFSALLGIVASCCNGWTDVRTHLFGQFPVLLIVSSAGFSFTVAAVSILIKRCRCLEYLGIHSLAIMVMHKFPVMFFKLLIPGVQELLSKSGSIPGFAAGLAVTAFSVAVCLVCERILLAIFPWALGIKNKKAISQ